MAISLRRAAMKIPLINGASILSSRSFSSNSDAIVELRTGEIGIVSGIPDEHLTRRGVIVEGTCDGGTILWVTKYQHNDYAGFPNQGNVVIHSPARSASQQGAGKVGRWKINFLSTQKWENPLMGWTSTGDPYANVGESALTFDSEEAAKAFAGKHGWQYVVKKRQTPLLKPKSYSDNFKWKGPPMQ